MTVRVINADVIEGLRQLPDESVHLVVTSPPYWGLRNYNVEGQIGLEATPQEFVARLVEVFREVRRVLRSDGVCFMNLGDSYCSTDKWGGGKSGNTGKQTVSDDGTVPSWAVRAKKSPIAGIKPKDLIGMPWRVAFALQDDGWWLRQDIIWEKPNPMPESVRDRCTKAHEYIFLLTKSERYFWDAEAIKEQAAYGFPNSPESIASPYGQGFTRRASAVEESARPPGTAPQSGMTRKTRKAGNKSHKYVDQYEADEGEGHRTKAGLMKVAEVEWMGRNKRSVWTMATTPFPEAHFATFPAELPATCIAAGTSEVGCCADCGAPIQRNIESEFVAQPDVSIEKGVRGAGTQKPLDATDQRQGFPRGNTHRKTTGWRPTCSCDASVAPCTVLDPFGGAGTTGMVADRLGRDAVLIELNPEYVGIIERRIARDRLERGVGTMVDVAAAKLPMTPLEALMQEAAE